MNRITFFSSIVILSLGISVWIFTTISIHSGTFPRTAASTVQSVIKEVGPSTVSIESASSNGNLMTTLDGTGIIVDPSGIILTSKHLVNEWFTYTIELQDGRKMAAKLLKIHPILDLALLSIISDTHVSFPVGKFIASQAHIYQWENVFTIGNMLGLYPWSVSEGIISGLDRVVSFGVVSMTWLIQTTIPMTLGNSGGPLIASNGSIIGINTGIVGGSSQIGWALPLTQSEVDDFIHS